MNDAKKKPLMRGYKRQGWCLWQGKTSWVLLNDSTDFTTLTNSFRHILRGGGG